MLAVSSSNHRQRSGRNLADGHAIPGSGLLLTTWQTPTLGFRKQERQLRTGSTGGCLRSIAQCTRSGACSYWIGHHGAQRHPTCTHWFHRRHRCSICHADAHLDYANALLHGALAGNIIKLHCDQNSLSRVVLHHHPGPASSRLSHLHWLPVCKWIQYKIALLAYKRLLTYQPPYLRNLRTCQPLCCLHSASQYFSCIPSCNTNFSRDFFSF